MTDSAVLTENLMMALFNAVRNQLSQLHTHTVITNVNRPGNPGD
jgi:hypothetical protein